MKKKRIEYLAEFQQQCVGCKFAENSLVGTGIPCCTHLETVKTDGKGNCATKTMPKKKWLVGECKVCGAIFEYQNYGRVPVTCGKYKCLAEAAKSGLFKKKEASK